VQTDPRFLGILKEGEEEEEEETPGLKNLRVHIFERRTNGTKARRIRYFNAVGIKEPLVPGICYLIRFRIRLVGTTNENQRKNNSKNN
jgi:hypothetical protein